MVCWLSLECVDGLHEEGSCLCAVDREAAQLLESFEILGDLGGLGDGDAGRQELDGHEGVVVDVEGFQRADGSLGQVGRDDAQGYRRQGSGGQQVPQLGGHVLGAAQLVVQGGLFDQEHETVAGLMDDLGALDAGGGGRGHIIGSLVEGGDGAQQGPGVALGLQNAGDDAEGVEAEQAGLLEELGVVLGSYKIFVSVDRPWVVSDVRGWGAAGVGHERDALA